MATSAVPAFLTALRSALIARPGLTGVGVFTAPPGDELPPEALVVDRVVSTQAWAALGRQKREEGFTVFLVAHAAKPGTGEAIFAELRDRCFALAAEVENALRDDVSVAGTVRVAQFARGELRQGAGTQGRWAQIEMQIDAAQRI
jgi:hypothetical protein